MRLTLQTITPSGRKMGVTCLLLTLLLGAGARAQQPQLPPGTQAVQVQTEDRLAAAAFPLDDKNPEASVPSMEQAMKKPLQMGYFVMVLIERGQTALDKKDFAAAVRYYRALAKALPERAKSYSLLCRAYQGTGQLAEALDACRTALGKEAVTIEDNARFVELVLAQPGKLAAKDVEDVHAVVAHLEKEIVDPNDAKIIPNQLECELAARLEDVPALKTCSTVLRQVAPRDARTFAFAWVLALKQRDLAAAEQLLVDARSAGLSDPALAKMEAGLSALRDGGSSRPHWVRQYGLIGSLLIALIAVLSAALHLGRKKRLAAS
jgi:hypothetical protein